MSQLRFNRLASQQLVALRSDRTRAQLNERVLAVLAEIEYAPQSQSVRRRRYLRPSLWGVPVHGSGEDWLILWRETDWGQGIRRFAFARGVGR